MLSCTLLRELSLHPDHTPAFISAASGMSWVGATLYVVADDGLHLGIFSDADNNPGHVLRMLPGELPTGHQERKASKPDFEVLTHWATYTGAAGGALVALGSGSKPNRCTGVLIPLDARQEVCATPIPFDMTPLYLALERQLTSLNIEGAIFQADALWLFQRGNSEEGINALVKVPLPAFQHCIDNPTQTVSSSGINIEPLAIGARDGVPLTFTDATLLADGRILFSAAAEDTTNTYHDGDCAGSALGMLSATGELLWCQPLAGKDKVEGIAARMHDLEITCLLVTDADDSEVAAKLLQVILPR